MEPIDVNKLVEEVRENFTDEKWMELAKVYAKMSKMVFDALVAEGFTEEQALQVVCRTTR